MSSVTFAEKKSAAPASKGKTGATAVSSGLRIGATNDYFEQEADRVADEVMAGGIEKREWALSRMSVDAPLQRKCSCGGSEGSGEQCEECKEKEQKTLQRKASGSVESDIAPPIVREVLNSPGEPLDKASRDFFESRFGRELSDVRIHVDDRAAESAGSVRARAYTVGNQIVFAESQYHPESLEGRRLLAHEIGHVVQQQRTRPAMLQRDTSPDEEASPVQSMWGQAFALADQSKWEEVAEIVNGFSPEDLRVFIESFKAQPDKVSYLYEGAIGNRKVGPDSQIAKATLYTHLDFKYEEQKRRKDWYQAAEYLNGFNRDDIFKRLHQLKTEELSELHDKAVANPAAGPDSGSAKYSAEELAGRPQAEVAAKAASTPTSAPAQGKQAPKEAELSLLDKAIIEVAVAPTMTMGLTVHDMVKATFTGFFVEVKTQAPSRGKEFWEHVKEAFRHPTQIGGFLLRYWWGLAKGIFSPITGLFDMGKLVFKLGSLGTQVLTTAWERREELAIDAAGLSSGLDALGKRAHEAISAFWQKPLDTIKALGPWFSSLQKDALSAAELGGHKAGAALMEQAGKPLPELGETAGEVIGSLIINVVLLVFTEGIGNAITQVATKLGELGAFLGKFGRAAEMLGKLAAEIGDLLGTIGGWISKAEAAFAKVAETVLKPIAPLMEELGKLMSGLRSFLRKLLGVSEKAASGAAEELAGAAAKTVEGRLPAPPVTKPVPKPTVSAVKAADESVQAAGAEALVKPRTPPTAEVQAGAPVTSEGGATAGAAKPIETTPAKPTPLASRSKVFEGISDDTEKLLGNRPGLARALEQHPEAADFFKLCESPCFPDFMTDEEIAGRLIRLERMQKAAAEAGVTFDRALTKKLLHRQKTVGEIDNVLSSLEDALGLRIRGVYAPGKTDEAVSGLLRPATKMPPRPRGSAAAGTQIGGRPETVPPGYGDLPEQTGAGERATPGGRGQKPKTEAGLFAHEHAEILQRNPEILDDLERRTGQTKIFDTELPEGLEPEYKIPHKEYPPGARPSIDRLWRKGDTIFEIKPNTLAEKGAVQAQQYAEWMDKVEPLPGGQKWKWKVVQYDQDLLMEYLRAIGQLR